MNTPAHALIIRMFGTFEVVREGKPLHETAWHTQQAKQVLKVLVLARGRAVPSDRLIEWLWPDANPATTSTTLRSTVHALRRALEPDRPARVPSRYIVTRTPGYAFEPGDDTWVDVYAFEDLLDRAGQTHHPGQRMRLLREALDLYRGDLLEEDPYAEWAIAERERLRERYLDALLDLAELHASAGEYGRAIAACRRALARDEYRESVYRALMRYQVLAGDVAAALNTYERCRAMLREEFGAEPAPQTQALYEAIVRGEIPAPRAAPPDTVPTRPHPPASLRILPTYERPFQTLFVGREKERASLRAALARAQEGYGGTMAVTGAMGMGKTHLVLHVLEQFPDIHVLGTRCLSMEQALPFAALTNPLRRFLEALPPERLTALPPSALAQTAQLIPSLHYTVPDLPPVPNTTPDENRGRLLDGLANLLVALSDQAPLVLFLDDVHWADEGTVALLGRLAYRAVRHPLLIMLTYPPGGLAENEDLRDLRAQLLHDGLLKEVHLHPLAREDVADLLRQIWENCSGDVDALTDHIFRHTEGVPLYLVELAREIAARGGPPTPEKIPPLQRLSLVRTLILNRVERLSPQARDVLHLAAIIGRAFPLELLETAAPFDPLPGLEDLLATHFLQEEEDGRLAFTHDVIRQVVYASLPTLARRRLHRQVAEALVALHGSEAGSHAVRVAYHYREAGPRHASAALQFAVLAGDHLRHSYGFRQAVEHYRQALQAARWVLNDDQAHTWIRRAYVGLGLAYEAQGDWEGIVTTYVALREWAESQSDAELAAMAARRLMAAMAVIGRLDEAAVMAGEVLASGAPRHPALEEIFRRLQVVFGREEPQETSGAAWPAYKPPPPPVGRPWEEIINVVGRELAPLPLALYGWSLALQGYLKAAELCLHDTIALAEATAQRPYAILAHHFLAHTAFMRDDVRRIQAHLDKGFRLARQIPEAEWSTYWGRVFESYIHLHLGDVGAAGDRFAALANLLKDRGGFRSHLLSAWTGLALVAIARKDLDEATARLDRVLAERDNLDVVTAFWARVAEAAIARRMREWERAEERVRAALAFAGRRGLSFEYVSAVEEATRLMVSSGRVADALPLVAAVQNVAEQAHLPVVDRILHRVQARLRRAGVLPETEAEQEHNASRVS